jgi:phytoene/squalene synthetase
MNASTASSVTKAASKQTYYTIRFLVDRERIDDAYRAYGYFRWVDDLLDAEEGSSAERMAFLERQKTLLEKCFRGQALREGNGHENMLVELVRQDTEKNSGLQIYLRNMMQVMDFDVGRRGRLISQGELNEYTRWLATAVMECIHYFIGHDEFAPHDETRYLAVSAAHITHMLRDTFDDARLGYYNIPREVLGEDHFDLNDLHSAACRDWVKSRVELARMYFKAGRDYFARVQNPRCRLACYAYIARFDWLLDTLEREGYCLRPAYAERKSPGMALRMGWHALSSTVWTRQVDISSVPVPSQQQGGV